MNDLEASATNGTSMHNDTGQKAFTSAAAEAVFVPMMAASRGLSAPDAVPPAACMTSDMLDELVTLREENAALREELDDVKASFAETLADNENMGRVIDAADQLKAAMDEAKRLRAVADSAERVLRAKSGEVAEAIRTAKYWKNRAEKAEKLYNAAV